MCAVGVVAEYNPFHRGHAFHLAEAKRLAGADIAVAVMSGSFTQRGEPALFSTRDRVRMALAAGADAIFLMPALWSVRDAEHFALGGVSLLDRLGCDAISFGVETDDLPLLRSIAELLEEEPPAFRKALKELLDRGIRYPAASAEAAEQLFPGASAVLRQPNNTLAVCYLRALQRLSSRMTPVPVRRVGGYHDQRLDPAAPSSSAIRRLLIAGETEEAMKAVPDACRPILLEAVRQGRIHTPDALDAALLYRLLTMSDAEWQEVPGRSEGIENRVRLAAARFPSRDAILREADTRRYPEARLSRLLTHALLRITQADLDAQATPPGAVPLGLLDRALPFLKRASENGLPVYGKTADWISLPDPWARVEQLADELWWVGCGMPPNTALCQPVVRVIGSPPSAR